MKKFLKFNLLFYFSLYTTNELIGNLTFSNGLTSILQVSFILTLFELILKPILKILLLPINILTLGFFRIIIDIVGIYLALFFIDTFKVNNFSLWGYNFFGILAIIGTSVIINFVFLIFNSIVAKKSKK
jgi:putative membrane protein